MGEFRIWSLAASAFNSDDFVNRYFYITMKYASPTGLIFFI